MDNQVNVFSTDPQFEKNVKSSLEPLRQSYQTSKNLTIGGLVVAFILFAIVGNFFAPAFLIAMVLICISGYSGVQVGKIKREYDSIYKQFVVEKVIKQTIDDYQYDPIGRFDPHYLDALRLFAREVRYCTYKGEDMIRGTYKGVRFQQADAIISYTVGSGKNRRTVWVMRGRISEFEYGKEIHSSVLVVPKAYAHANSKGLQKVHTENVSFHKKYNVYSGDAHTAFYVLTPQLMEYIDRLNSKTMTYVRFINGRVLIIQPNAGGAFEPNMSRNFDFMAECQHVKNDMSALFSIIDIMELDDSMEQHKNLMNN